MISLAFADCFEHAFAEVALFVTVTQFDGFILPGGCATWYGGCGDRAVDEHHIGLDGRIAA